MSRGKTRVAILGGGISALSTAYELTRPQRDGRYEVTVYQMGWRLGGKGASSRNAAHGHRIEEHGLHLWGGCYENAFRLIRACYARRENLPDEALQTWQQGFQPRHTTVLQERMQTGHTAWVQRFAALPTLPGEGDSVAGLSEMVWGLFKWGLGALFSAEGEQASTPFSNHAAARTDTPTPVWIDPAHPLAKLADEAQQHILRFLSHPGVLGVGTQGLRRAMEALQWALHKFNASLDRPGPRRSFITADYVFANLIGVLEDGLAISPDGRLASYGQWLNNLARIDGLDYRVWLQKHGAHDATLNSCIVRGLGDAVFNSGYEGAAGAALNGLLRLNLTYRGAIFWQMQAGMGEVVFTPLYEALKAQGVRFEFFHRVEALQLDARRRRVRSIKMTRQAQVREGGYQPLVEVPHPDGTLRCWPAEPDWQQLRGGAALSASQIDFESSDAVPGQETIEVSDFDQVVLGIPIAALPPLTTELVKARPQWAAMFEHIKTTPTQSAQLWFERTGPELGWQDGNATCTAYAEPLDTWAEMSHLLRTEAQPNARHIAYLVGSIQHEVGANPETEVRELTESWLKANAGHLVPGFVDSTGELKHEALLADTGVEGSARLDAQYYRANTKASEQYALSIPGSARYRLRPHQSGFDNLLLAGDWTKTGLNVGSIEAAVMSGLRAAKGITQDDVLIVGDYED